MQAKRKQKRVHVREQAYRMRKRETKEIPLPVGTYGGKCVYRSAYSIVYNSCQCEEEGLALILRSTQPACQNFFIFYNDKENTYINMGARTLSPCHRIQHNRQRNLQSPLLSFFFLFSPMLHPNKARSCRVFFFFLFFGLFLQKNWLLALSSFSINQNFNTMLYHGK